MSASLSATIPSGHDERPADNIRHMIDYMRAFTHDQSPDRPIKESEDGGHETSEETRRATKFKGRASSADDRSLERQAKRARLSFDHTTDLEDATQDTEELRTSWMDVRPSTGDVEARSSSHSSLLANSHARRFTVDSLARPEELLASLLHQPHSSHQHQHRQQHDGAPLLPSPSSNSALMPTLSQSPDGNVNWLSSPFEHDRGDSFLDIPPPGMSARSWTDVEASLKHPPSLTSTSEVGSLDNSDVPASVSQFLQHPRHLAWIRALRKGEQIDKSVSSSSPAKVKSASSVEHVHAQAEVHPTPWVQQAIRVPVWQQKSMANIIGGGEDGRAQPCSSSFDELLSNIATSICHQSNAAAVAASAFEHEEAPWPASLHLHPVMNRPILTTGPASFPLHDGNKASPSSQMVSKNSGAATSSAKQRTSSGDTGPPSAPRIKRESAGSPSQKQAKRPGRQKVSAESSSQGVKEQMTKQEREQRRLADRRRRRRESHNAVERRRRDLINERIAELATLLPETVLMEAIAHSTSGGTAPHIDLAPFARAGTSFDAISSSGGAIDDDDGAADSIACSKPNKGIILTKSVEYIKHLHEVCTSMRGKVIELQNQLDSVRRAVFANTGEIPHAGGAGFGPSSIGGLQMMHEVHRIRANSGTVVTSSEPYVGGLGQTSPDPSPSMMASAQTPISPA